MEYIQKFNEKYISREGDVEIDYKNTFPSRVGTHGVGGEHVNIPVGDFNIEWLSNFGYGYLSFGGAYVSFKKIYIKKYENVETTERFVEILNMYSNISEADKDDIIVELANKLAHVREAVNCNRINSMGNDSRFLKPTISLHNFEDDINIRAIQEIRDMVLKSS